VTWEEACWLYGSTRTVIESDGDRVLWRCSGGCPDSVEEVVRGDN
jgi:hypothetical protein